MTLRYRLTPPAVEDLKQIWHYTVETHGEAQADQYLASLKAGCEQIAKSPNRWRSLMLGSQEVRFYRCEHHYIVYAVIGIKGAKIAILAFLHERMDLVARLADRLT